MNKQKRVRRELEGAHNKRTKERLQHMHPTKYAPPRLERKKTNSTCPHSPSFNTTRPAWKEKKTLQLEMSPLIHTHIQQNTRPVWKEKKTLLQLHVADTPPHHVISQTTPRLEEKKTHNLDTHPASGKKIIVEKKICRMSAFS